MSNSPNTLPSVESLVQRAEEFARREPAKAVASAFGTGVLLNMLPLGAIASACTGVAFSLVRPALLFLGVRKACELCLTPNTETQSYE